MPKKPRVFPEVAARGKGDDSSLIKTEQVDMRSGEKKLSRLLRSCFPALWECAGGYMCRIFDRTASISVALWVK